MCSREDLLDLGNEEYMVFYRLSRQDSSSSLTPAILGHLSTGEELQQLSLRPMSLLPHSHTPKRMLQRRSRL